jgi:ribonucleotide monophosphatase NagD (HAD superfamily)
LYDHFILDQFGVLHNGQNALDGAIELCDYLYRKKKQLIILSNTSAPASKALQKLPQFGFDSNHFVDAVTSGEEASRYIRETYGSGGGDDSTKVIFITWDAYKDDNPRLTALPEAFIEQCGTNVEIATSVDEADLLLLHGSEVWYRGPNAESMSIQSFIDHGQFHDIDPILEDCAARGLPAVCANPDIIVQTPAGDGVSYMPGGLAERYTAQFGGTCRTFGKPSVEHFEACIRKLGKNIPKHKVAHVGDSLHHDISGAIAAGIPNIFVTSGIHRQQFGTQFGELPDDDILQQVLEEEGNVRPTHIVPAFRL